MGYSLHGIGKPDWNVVHGMKRDVHTGTVSVLSEAEINIPDYCADNINGSALPARGYVLALDKNVD